MVNTLTQVLAKGKGGTARNRPEEAGVQSRARTKVRELRKLGTLLHTAISVAISRKGSWRLSRTLATQTGMTNDWLKDQGLLSVKELWVHIHYPATARSSL